MQLRRLHLTGLADRAVPDPGPAGWPRPVGRALPSPPVSGTTSSEFDEATAVREVGPGRYEGTVVEGWDVRGNPHGGFLLALVTRAMAAAVDQSDPLSVSATYLAPPDFGPAQVEVEVLRAGKRQSTISGRLVQDGTARVHAVATFGTLSAEPPQRLTPDLAAPQPLPPPEACPSTDVIDREGLGPVNLHERLLVRFHPETGWIHGTPSGNPEMNGWMRHTGREPDLLGLLMFSDGMPPSLYEARGRQGVHTPTVQLTTHIFAHPAPGWVQGSFRTRVLADGFLDQDGELWDSTGTLVATTRQLGLVRTWT